MGPTTAALFTFFQADLAFHEAKQKLESATRAVRTQEAKVAQLKTEHDTAHTSALQLEAKAREAELELKAKESRIELLRDRQTNATNPKEYQALIVEINTLKTDKGKLEEQVLSQIEQVATLKKQIDDLSVRHAAESATHEQMSNEIGDRVKQLTAQVDTLRGPRDELAAQLPPGALQTYKRADDRYPGEALSPIEKPNPRDQEYLCSGCNTYLVADVYNRLRNTTRDEINLCPSCHRVLYIPEEMTAEIGLRQGGKTTKTKTKAEPGEKKPRASKKKAAATGPIDPNSIAGAIAAGSSAATGRGFEDRTKPAEAPLPSTADGVANITTDTTTDDETPSA